MLTRRQMSQILDAVKLEVTNVGGRFAFENKGSRTKITVFGTKGNHTAYVSMNCPTGIAVTKMQVLAKLGLGASA